MPAAMAPFQMTGQQRASLEAICRRFNVARLELFGSAATEAYRPDRSDLDFLVEFVKDANLGPWLAGYFDLQQALEGLFDRPVDLVFLSALKNPYFVQSVNKTRQVVYEHQVPEAA
jgi:hypothetical protein